MNRSRISKRRIFIEEKSQLRVKSQVVNFFENGLASKLWHYLDSAYMEMDGHVNGISAIQLGLPYRAALVKFKDGRRLILYNPIVKFKFGFVRSNEGCLSLPGKRYKVWRPLLIKLSYAKLDGELCTDIFTYSKARLIMHEIDHMNGVLICDKGKEVKNADYTLFAKI